MGCVLVNCLICIIRTFDLNEGRINIRRLKNGFSTVHPLRFDEREPWNAGPRNVLLEGADRTDAIFISRRGSRLSRQQAYRIIRDAGIEAGTVTQTHPHMLRHACGYELAERGADTRLIQDYLGIEIFALRQVGIRPADEDGLSLQGQRSIHILHSRQHQQYRGLVDPCALHLCLFSADIQRVKRRKKGRIEPGRIQLYLAPDTVGVDDLPTGISSGRIEPLRCR